MIVAVAGCVAQAEGAEIVARAPFVDIVFGPQTYHRLPEMVARAARAGGARARHRASRPKPNSISCPRRRPPQGSPRFLTIQEGCDKFCTFCVVPYTRGAEYSRPAARVIAEARRLVARRRARDHAARPERQCLSRRRRRRRATGALGELIRALAEIAGPRPRIRYTTSHPRDVDDELIAAHRDVPQLMPFLHLPVQIGSDRVLAAMNRRHTADDYRRIVERLRAARPDLALLLRFHRRLSRRERCGFRARRSTSCARSASPRPSRSNTSPRPGTPAAAAARAGAGSRSRPSGSPRCRRCWPSSSAPSTQACVGRALPVLFEKPGRHPGQLVGRSPYLQSVHADGGRGADRRDRPGADQRGAAQQPCRRDRVREAAAA